jgi:hypothetical protein
VPGLHAITRWGLDQLVSHLKESAS